MRAALCFPRFFYQKLDGSLVPDFVARNQIAEIDFVVKVAEPKSLFRSLRIVKLRKSAIVKIRLEFSHDFIFAADKGNRIRADSVQGKMLCERKRKNVLNKKSSAKNGCHFLGKHFGIASGDENRIFVVRQPACEFFPAHDILNLVKKNKRLVAEHLAVALQKQVKVGKLNSVKAIVLKVEVKNFLYFMPLCQQVMNALEQIK